MVLFSKTTSLTSDFITVVYTPDGIIVLHNPALHLNTAKANRIIAKYGKDKAYTMCVYKFPSAKWGIAWYQQTFADKYNKDKQTYVLTRDDMQRVYANWRRCYSMGYDCSMTFAVHYRQLDMQMIRPSCHLSFDVRLGYACQMDRVVARVIGYGEELFTRWVNGRPPKKLILGDDETES